MLKSTSEHLAPGKPRRIELDFVRGVAILVVMLFHFTDLDSPPGGWARLPFFAAHLGRHGVDLFFVLSGFLVGGLLLKEWKDTGGVDARRFLLRRMLKLWPPLYVLLVFHAVLGRHPLAGFLWQNLLHIQNFMGTTLPQTRSLAVEEHFYLLLTVGIMLLAKWSGGGEVSCTAAGNLARASALERGAQEANPEESYTDGTGRRKRDSGNPEWRDLELRNAELRNAELSGADLRSHDSPSHDSPSLDSRSLDSLRRSTRGVFAFCLGGALLSLMSRCGTVYFFPDAMNPYWTQNRLDGPFLGVALATLFHLQPEAYRKVALRRWPLVLGCVAGVACLVWMPWESNALVTVGLTLFALACCAFVVLMLEHSGGARQWLLYRMVARLGVYAYGIFLWHSTMREPVLRLFARLPESWGWMVTLPCQMATGCVLGFVMTHLVEWPFLRWRESKPYLADRSGLLPEAELGHDGVVGDSELVAIAASGD